MTTAISDFTIFDRGWDQINHLRLLGLRTMPPHYSSAMKDFRPCSWALSDGCHVGRRMSAFSAVPTCRMHVSRRCHLRTWPNAALSPLLPHFCCDAVAVSGSTPLSTVSIYCPKCRLAGSLLLNFPHTTLLPLSRRSCCTRRVPTNAALRRTVGRRRQRRSAGQNGWNRTSCRGVAHTGGTQEVIIRPILLWILGIPISVIILLYLFNVL
jgi:hypothetical protein